MNILPTSGEEEGSGYEGHARQVIGIESLAHASGHAGSRRHRAVRESSQPRLGFDTPQHGGVAYFRIRRVV